MNEDKNERTELRKLQDNIIAIGERMKVDLNTPISCVQYQAPTINQLRNCLWFDFQPSMNSFLEHFGG